MRISEEFFSSELDGMFMHICCDPPCGLGYFEFNCPICKECIYDFGYANRDDGSAECNVCKSIFKSKSGKVI